MPLAFPEIAFTPAVRDVQERMGSARGYTAMLGPDRNGGDRIGPDEARFIEDRDGFYQASVSETGWPYVQFRGGPKGFLKVLDDRTIAYADLRGNRQYVSLGNFAGNDRVALILTDYPNQARLKLLGHATATPVADAPELTARLMPEGQKMTPEHIVTIRVAALDWNCPRNIPIRLTPDELVPHLAPMSARIQALEAENADLRARIGD